jgi:hypothetical protein
MPDEALRREQARKALIDKKLPARAPDRTWGGHGVGALCVICGEPVTKDEIEYELQFVHDGATPGLDKYTLHMRCFAAWEFERTKLPPYSAREGT